MTITLRVVMNYGWGLRNNGITKEECLTLTDSMRIIISAVLREKECYTKYCIEWVQNCPHLCRMRSVLVTLLGTTFTHQICMKDDGTRCAGPSVNEIWEVNWIIHSFGDIHCHYWYFYVLYTNVHLFPYTICTSISESTYHTQTFCPICSYWYPYSMHI